MNNNVVNQAFPNEMTSAELISSCVDYLLLCLDSRSFSSFQRGGSEAWPSLKHHPSRLSRITGTLKMHFVVSWNPIHQPIGTAVSDSRTLLPCVMSSASHGEFPYNASPRKPRSLNTL
jgi:hypothetical protein